MLPAQAEVNLYYDMGTSALPVEWDLSAVDLNEEGTYQVTGIVQSLSSNKDAWVGKDGSTAYKRPDRELYSSRAIQVTAQVQITEKTEDPVVLTRSRFCPDRIRPSTAREKPLIRRDW